MITNTGQGVALLFFVASTALIFASPAMREVPDSPQPQQVITARDTIVSEIPVPPPAEVFEQTKARQVYDNILMYADTFDIPLQYAFGVAYEETRFTGPDNAKYKAGQTSHAGAEGPMQVMPATAAAIMGRTIPRDTLRNNIQLNVMISMKLLRRLHDKHGDWRLVLGAYNSGKLIFNGYAKRIYVFDKHKAYVNS